MLITEISETVFLFHSFSLLWFHGSDFFICTLFIILLSLFSCSAYSSLPVLFCIQYCVLFHLCLLCLLITFNLLSLVGFVYSKLCYSFWDFESHHHIVILNFFRWVSTSPVVNSLHSLLGTCTWFTQLEHISLLSHLSDFHFCVLFLQSLCSCSFSCWCLPPVGEELDQELSLFPFGGQGHIKR